MTQDNPLLTKLAEDQQQVEQSIDFSKSRSSIVPSKLNRRMAYHQNRRTLWLVMITIISLIIIYPVIAPLLNAAFLYGNLIALALICFFMSAILSILSTEKLDDE